MNVKNLAQAIEQVLKEEKLSDENRAALENASKQLRKSETVGDVKRILIELFKYFELFKDYFDFFD